MSVIDHQSKIIRNFHKLHSSFDLRLFESGLDVSLSHLEMQADCNGCQRIVNAEFSRNINLHIHVYHSCGMIGNAEVAGFVNHLEILCPEIVFLGETEGLHLQVWPAST